MDHILNSLPAQFAIGGTTVAGISHISKIMSPLVAGIFGGIPVGLPSTIFLDQTHVTPYLQTLSVMSFILFSVTAFAFYLSKYKGVKKYGAVSLSMLLWVLLAVGYYFVKK